MNKRDLHMRNSRIYLTGFMGSGKSTIGPILANTIGYDFVDLDRMIEGMTGMSVTRLFREQGEKIFRSLEHRAIVQVSATPRVVVSLGGGTVTEPATHDLIKSTGIVVYLSLSSDELMRRLQRRTDRPLLMNADGERLSEEALRERVQSLREQREPLYSQADIVVPTDEKRLGITVDRIVKLLAPHLG